jgi:hypothetical protein
LAIDGAIKIEPGVALEISAAADAVHQVHPRNVRGIGMTVDIKLQTDVERNNPSRRMISGLLEISLRAQYNPAGEEVHVVVNLL